MEKKTVFSDIALPEVIYENYIEDKLEQDLMIPDYHASAQKIVHCTANVVIHGKSIRDGKIAMDGVCVWKILYLSEEDQALHHISCERPFTEYFSSDVDEGSIRYKIKIQNVMCKLLSSRRAVCKATMCIALKVVNNSFRKTLAGSGEEEIQLFQSECSVYEPVAEFEKEFRVSGEIELGNQKERSIFKTTAEVTIRDCKCMEDKVVIKGTCKNKVFTLENDSCSADCFETETSFTQAIDAPGVKEGHKACVRCDVLEVDTVASIDAQDGYYITNANLSALISVYSHKSIPVCTDAYHPIFDLDIKKEKIEFYKDIQNIEMTTRLSQRIPFNAKNMTMLYTETAGDVEKIGVENGVLIVDGKVAVQCAYCVDDDVNMAVLPMSFQTTRNMDECCERMKCEADLRIENFNFIILSDNEIEMSCDCRILLTVYTYAEENVVTDIQVTSTKKEEKLTTPLVIYYGSKGEKLWDIGKKYSVPMKTLMENNDLSDNILIEDKLIFISRH